MISNVAQHKSKNGVLAPFWDSALIEKTASGAVASFSDGADGMPMVSVVADIDAVQSGTGDPSPSNVRPISGWDSVNVTRAGKNLLPPTVYNLAPLGQSLVSDANYRSMWCAVTGGETYTISRDIISGNRFRIYCTTDVPAVGVTAVKIVESDTALTLTITVPETYNYLFIYLANNGSEITSNIQVELGSTASDFEPIQTYPTTLPQTVYGGHVDIVKGELVIDKALVDLGTLTFTKNDSSLIGVPCFYATIPSVKSGAPYVVCSNYTIKRKRTSIDGTGQISPGNAIDATYCVIRDDRYAAVDAATFKTAMSSVQLVYELATPQTIQLTPQEVDSLLADNNLWADSGDVSVVYRADSTLAYEQLTNAIVSLGGNI